jgi:hypothetical protein
MKAAVERVCVFATARIAHREIAHSRIGAVIRHVFDYREARAAVRAVDERIAEASVARVEHFTDAVFACGYVGRDGDELFSVGGAFYDLKIIEVREKRLENAFDRFDPRERRRIGFHFGDELVDSAWLALDIYQHARRVIEHATFERAATGLRENKRAKPDALNYATHQYVNPRSHSFAFFTG